MHILDVISSVSRPSKCNKIVGGWGLTPDPTGRADSAPPNPLAGFKRPTLRPLLLSGVEGRGGKGDGAKMIFALGRQKPSCCHCSSEVGQGALEHWFAGAHNLKYTMIRYKTTIQKSKYECMDFRSVNFPSCLLNKKITLCSLQQPVCILYRGIGIARV